MTHMMKTFCLPMSPPHRAQVRTYTHTYTHTCARTHTHTHLFITVKLNHIYFLHIVPFPPNTPLPHPSLSLSISLALSLTLSRPLARSLYLSLSQCPSFHPLPTFFFFVPRRNLISPPASLISFPFLPRQCLGEGGV